MEPPRSDDDHQAREQQIQNVVSTLKTLADATEGDPRLAAQRLGTRLIVHGLGFQKQAARPTEAIALAALAEKSMGPDFATMEPESFLDMGFSENEVAGILAVAHATQRSLVFERWDIFARFCCAVNDFSTESIEALTLPEVAWGVDCARYCDPHAPWDDEVKAYIACLASEEGYVLLPKMLAFAQPALMTLLSLPGKSLANNLSNGICEGEAAHHQVGLVQHLLSYVTGRHRTLNGQLKKV